VVAGRPVNKGFSVQLLKKDKFFNNLWKRVARLAEAAQGTQVDIQIGRGEARLFGHLAHLGILDKARSAQKAGAPG
jgi:hypothetical protein